MESEILSLSLKLYVVKKINTATILCFRFCNQPQYIPIGSTLIEYGSMKLKIERVFIFVTPPLCQKKILRFYPTLGSNNSGLKNCRIKNHHIFGIAWTSAFIWHIWIPLEIFCNATRRVCVCIVLVPFGPFSQRINGKSLKLDV